MSLKIVLKPFEKIIINQAVIQNGKTKTEITLESKASILRKKDIYQEEEANTPSKALYYLLQMSYLFPEESLFKLDSAMKLATDIQKAAPSLSAQILHVIDSMSVGHFYKALKECQKLITLEEEILKNVR